MKNSFSFEISIKIFNQKLIEFCHFYFGNYIFFIPLTSCKNINILTKINNIEQ